MAGEPEKQMLRLIDAFGPSGLRRLEALTDEELKAAVRAVRKSQRRLDRELEPVALDAAVG